MTEVICVNCETLIGRTKAGRVPAMLCANETCDWPSSTRNRDRDAAIVRAVREDKRGVTEVADSFSITRQRVYQILAGKLEK